MSETALNLHGSCVVLAEAAVLIRGASGSGKSTLARRLVARRFERGGFACLVADDRVVVSRHHGRLIARPHRDLAGLVEHRGLGLRRVPHVEAAVLRLVLDLVEASPRMPEPADLQTPVLGLALPRIAAALHEAEELVDEALSWPR